MWPDSSTQKHFLLPDICRNSSVLLSIIVVQVVAIIVSLTISALPFSKQLALTSFYFLWVTLLSTLLLCRLRKRVREMPFIWGFLISFCVCMGAYAVVEVFTQAMHYRWSGAAFDWSRFWRYGLAAALAFLIILRFFSLLGLYELRHRGEAEARIQALQSRINPHFLFNSLNTISELTATKPEQAEEAIAALSVLFRASLEQAKTAHSLAAEVSLSKRYAELEQWRLGARLKLKWRVNVKTPDTWQVPILILQPLIENAVLHGQNKAGRVRVVVDIKETEDEISMLVLNSKGLPNETVSAFNKGNGIAIDNIKQRLFMLYDDHQTLKIKDTDARHQVIVRLPKRRLTAQVARS